MKQKKNKNINCNELEIEQIPILQIFFKKIKLVILLIVPGLLISCNPIVGSGQSSFSRTIGAISSYQTVGQTFVSRHNGLNALLFYLEREDGGDGKIVVYLYDNPEKNGIIASGEIPVSNINQRGWYLVKLNSILKSNLKRYYVELSLKGSGEVFVFGDYGRTYNDGSAYLNNKPAQDAQLAFRLVYHPEKVVLGLLEESFIWARWLLVSVFLFLFPGISLGILLWPNWPNYNVVSKISIGYAIGLALYPLLFLWTNIFGFHLGVVYSLLPGILSIVFLLNRLFRRSFIIKFNFSDLLKPEILTLIIVIGLLVISRFYAVRTLPAPMWGDALQHSMITQLVLDNKGLFNDWAPYAELRSFTYHFGFHVGASVFAWITGLSGPKAVLWFAQIINILAILSLYPLAIRLGKNQWGGIVALLVAGFISPMPMFYVNWGRFTQLTGQILLPVIILFVFEILDKPISFKEVGLLSLLMAGLALIHYRVLILAVIFWFVIVGVWFINKQFDKVFKFIFVGLISGGLFLPWFVKTFEGNITRQFLGELRTLPNAMTEWTRVYNSAGPLEMYLPIMIWLLMIIAVGFSLWKRDKEHLILSIWLFCIILATNPHWLHLPGTGAISNFAILIAAYIPASLFIGSMVGLILSNLHFHWRIALAITIIGLSVWGARQRVGDVQPQNYLLLTWPDVYASEWIKKNTAPDSKFLVNGFPAYGGSVVVGSDGGWWLPLSAHRKVNIPPLNYGSESGPVNNYIDWTNKLIFMIRSDGMNSQEVKKELCSRGLNYVYIGQQQGLIGAGAEQLLTPNMFSNDSTFQKIYNEDRVSIFKINCP